ncbi:MFS transporter [Ornithobacterium rhinotracheale]|uniref:MFS transporter n=1 Tax=Ornithobacterium rhinotracheale TaxID=28251 RepID=A0A3R5UY97_ORNRH|nr:MFS transporter [Ornithobacterium rhinotracheale]QAR31267.1 MFS transporter [Ornithobacterium rhinotracheale]
MKPEYTPQQWARIKKFLPYIMATAIFMQMLDSTILNTALPAMAESLNASPLNMQSAIISYVITLALFIPISGFLADRFGTQKVFISALFIFGLGSLMCALSFSLRFLVLSRIVQGLGGALMTPVARLALMKTYERSEFVEAMNFAIIPALIGPIVGPLVGGYLVDYLSWHYIFLINLPIVVVGILLSLKFMPQCYGERPRLDLKGFLLFGVSSVLLSAALEVITEESLFIYGLIMLVVGLIFLPIYFWHAKRSEAPIFPIHLFKVRTFRIGLLGNLACRLGISSLPLLVPLLMQIDYEQSAVISGWIVAPMALSAMLAKPFVVPILNRVGYRRILIGNTLIIGLLIASIAIPARDCSVYVFVPLLVILGFFNSVQFTAMNSIAIADLRDYQTSSGNSLLSVNQQIAIGFGIAIGLAILRFFQHNTYFAPLDMHQAFRLTFLSIGAITLASTWVFARLNPTDGDNLKSRK